MSGIVRPKGGASSAVYWRRRLVLVAVALLVVAGGIKLFGGGGDESSEPAASDASDSKSSTESTESADDEQDEQAKKRRRQNGGSSDAKPGQANVAVTMERGEACDPTKVKVKPSLGSDEQAGGAVGLRLAVTTSGNSACVLDLGKHKPLLSVSDSDGLVWTSDRCDDLIDVGSVRLEPGWSTYLDAIWSGRASGRTCGDNADYASPGEYDVQAAILSGEPTEATITLPEPPKPDKNKGGNNGKKDKKNKKNKKNDKQGDGSQGGNSGRDESGGQGRGSNGEGSNQQRNN